MLKHTSDRLCLYKKPYIANSKQQTANSKQQTANICSYQVKKFVVRPWNLCLPEEKVSMKAKLARLNFCILSKLSGQEANFFLFYVVDGKKVVHTSCVVPYCWKFSFMPHNSYEIGPCYTDPSYRGRGIYPLVLNHITSQEEFHDTQFYMMISPQNLSSIRGVEKAGFDQIGYVYKTRFLKRYCNDDFFKL